MCAQKKKEGGGSWIRFFAKGKEAGFSFKEIEMLRNFAVKSKIKDPYSLFSSQAYFDRCISTMVRFIKISGENEEQVTQDFLSKIYDYRHKMEMDKGGKQPSISNTRMINEDQVLRILVEKTGVFRSQVVKNTSQYMTITRPVNRKIITKTQWEGTKITVFFWREDDAGYVFDSEVQDEVFSMGRSSLKIAHSDILLRTQKRKSLRLKTHQTAFLYLVPSGEMPHQMEVEPGLRCILEDLSDSGCAVTVGGKANAGLRVKVQFSLDSTAVCMTGTIRSINFNEDTNRSMLHIEAEPMPIEARNLIFGEMFGMLSLDNLKDLPVSIVDTDT
jgi:c-di-GMP-binding flagellar brake protein YcgR